MIAIATRLLALGRAVGLTVPALALLLFATSALAEVAEGPVAGSPAAFLEAFSDDAVKVLSDNSLSEDQRQAEFRRLLVEGFNIDWVGRFVLGRFWRTASEAQRREYRRLFEDFIIAAFARRLGDYAGETLSIGKIRKLSEKSAIVSSLIIRRQGEPVRVDWRLGRFRQRWRILDIMVEGISIAISQRQEFASVIRKNGGTVESLLKVLRERTGRRRVTAPRPGRESSRGAPGTGLRPAALGRAPGWPP